MPDRRLHKRYTVDFFDITSAVIRTNDIEIIDISPGGISLCVDKRLNLGKAYDLKIKSKDTVLNLTGIVMWSRISEFRKDPDGNSVPIYNAGLNFHNVSDSAGNAIRNFIEAHKKEDKPVDLNQINGIRLYTRVRINAPEKALILDQTESLKVKKLSYNGTLLESTQPIKINTRIPMIISLAEDKFILFKGRVASCLLIRNASPKTYDIGIEFSELSEKDRGILADFIRLLDTIDKSPSL